MVITSLIENLRSQVEWHQVLLELLKAESLLPPQTSLNELQDIISQRDLATKQIERLELGRVKMVEVYLKSTGLALDSNLEAIAKSLLNEQGDALLELKKHLLQKLELIRGFAHQCALQAQARANCFAEVSGSLHQTQQRTTTYSQYGQIQQPKGSVFLTRSI